jgi:hypothetical protein
MQKRGISSKQITVGTKQEFPIFWLLVRVDEGSTGEGDHGVGVKNSNEVTDYSDGTEMEGDGSRSWSFNKD